MIGKIFSHYKILEKLGEGGMGVVYKAVDTSLDRTVALKFLPASFSTDEEAKTRFIHEAKSASALDHNNICNIHAINETDDGQLFISMAFYEGETLKDRITKGPIGIDPAIRITLQICEGLEKAHMNDIVHRDIKPANIFITNDGVVKILDFGLAKAKGQTQLTKMGSTLGTVDYMSPEQATGSTTDRRTDIWSLGVMFYEMITGQKPFGGEYEQAVIYSILNTEPDAIPEIDKRVQHIIRKALAKNPDERYQNVGEIVEELRNISQGGEVKRIQTKKSKLPGIVVAAVVITIAVAIYLYMPTSKSAIETETIKTIAVLPFTDMSPNKDQEYFSDGISEELINTLSRNPKLRVIARTSSFYFKGTNTDIKTIAQRLNAKHILEGSVRKSGNNLRISADLVNAETEATLWSNTYDGTMNNIFALQDSISGNVAEALKAALLGKGEVRPEQKTDPEAYNNYLLGNHFYNLHGKENVKKAEDYYEKALSFDSTYAPAWVGLSTVHSRLAGTGHIPIDSGHLKALREAEKALALNPNLADAYAQIGLIKRNYDYDWTGAHDAYKKGLELEPDNVNVIDGSSGLAYTLGRLNEAIKLERRAIEIDPVKADGYLWLATYAFYAGLPDESISYFRKCIELNPQYPSAHSSLARSYLEKGKPDLALVEIEKEKDPFWKSFGLEIIYYALGKMNEADKKLEELIKSNGNDAAFQIAEIYAYRNEKDKAFEWLERAYKQRDGGLTNITGDPLLRQIVKDPRYAAFMKKMNLPM
jgi:serine/threonine-protein kinase